MYDGVFEIILKVLISAVDFSSRYAIPSILRAESLVLYLWYARSG